MKQLVAIFFIFTLKGYCQQYPMVDFIKAQATVTIHPYSKEVLGTVEYVYKVLSEIDSISIDASNFLEINPQENLKYTYNNKQFTFLNTYKPDTLTTHTLTLTWRAKPKKAMYFVGWENSAPNQVWTQGQGKDNSHWIPSFNDVNEKVVFNLTIKAPEEYKVIANGKLLTTENNQNYTSWQFKMEQPMSSYLLAVVVGNYKQTSLTAKSGTPIELYYYPADSLKVEPTYRYTKDIFDFLETEIGVPYPWQNYKEIPVHDFLYAGMENTGTTIFSDTFVIDSLAFNDRNFVNVNAHELAHQWFGNLITAKQSKHHWLQEGFATYYALLAEREVFGTTYFTWQLYTYAQELYKQNNLKPSGLLNEKASSLTFYKHGCWVLVALCDKIGEDSFNEIITNYLKKYAYKNVETKDFITEIEAVYERDLSDFYEEWIYGTEFPYDKAYKILKKSPFIQEYEMVDCEALNSKCSYYLNASISSQAKIKIINQAPQLINKNTFKNTLQVRQAIAKNLKVIPLSLKKKYEELLNDASYKTKEEALYKLWQNYPTELPNYLNTTKQASLQDNSLRILWLVLSLLNETVTNENTKKLYFNELITYTNEANNYEIRILAFDYLFMLDACNTTCKENLKQADSHYNWQLAKYAKQRLEQLNL